MNLCWKAKTNGTIKSPGTLARTRLTLPSMVAYRGREDEIRKLKIEYKEGRMFGKNGKYIEEGETWRMTSEILSNS
jgi:hypothetical protein